ncbi:VOC family protein [Alkalicaulis satelles]|uniref:VOC family protein n=1 Tax=Alkalicaulis satelles TaxID=2609175 RepID=A0A5M6ZN63_9PROT|nr:VOC family protein [Alkalicaulis satelles]KAA5805355.1 VOC family protein [Alkalicaulis satelles]
MPNKLAHFAIEADDVDRARQFYESVFGWRFSPWGPPGFYLIEGAGVNGALQQRREPAPDGRKGFECTFAVDDLDAAIARIEVAGGRIIGGRHAIPTIGELCQWADTEGNEALIMQYAPDRLKQMNLR